MGITNFFTKKRCLQIGLVGVSAYIIWHYAPSNLGELATPYLKQGLDAVYYRIYDGPTTGWLSSLNINNIRYNKIYLPTETHLLQYSRHYATAFLTLASSPVICYIPNIPGFVGGLFRRAKEKTKTPEKEKSSSSKVEQTPNIEDISSKEALLRRKRALEETLEHNAPPTLIKKVRFADTVKSDSDSDSDLDSESESELDSESESESESSAKSTLASAPNPGSKSSTAPHSDKKDTSKTLPVAPSSSSQASHLRPSNSLSTKPETSNNASPNPHVVFRTLRTLRGRPSATDGFFESVGERFDPYAKSVNRFFKEMFAAEPPNSTDGPRAKAK